MDDDWHLYLMACIYIFTGSYHFIKPRAFMRVMPNYLPYRKEIVYVSGLLEIIFGILLITPFKTYAAWSIIVLLISFYPVHIYMITNTKASLGLPKWVLYLRLILQLGLIYWAYIYTK